MSEKKRNILNIVSELTAIRKNTGLQQADLAQQAGISRMTISRIESGYDPRLTTVHELARALGLELMLVPRELREEVASFIQSGGRLLGQAPGAGAPKSVVELLAEPLPVKSRATGKLAVKSRGNPV